MWIFFGWERIRSVRLLRIWSDTETLPERPLVSKPRVCVWHWVESLFNMKQIIRDWSSKTQKYFKMSLSSFRLFIFLIFPLPGPFIIFLFKWQTETDRTAGDRVPKGTFVLLMAGTFFVFGWYQDSGSFHRLHYGFFNQTIPTCWSEVETEKVKELWEKHPNSFIFWLIWKYSVCGMLPIYQFPSFSLCS